MKRILTMSLCLSFSFLFAQEVSVKWGKDYEKKGKVTKPIGVSKEGNLLYPNEACVEKCQKLYGSPGIFNGIDYAILLNHSYAVVTTYNKDKVQMEVRMQEVEKNGNARGEPKLTATARFNHKDYVNPLGMNMPEVNDHLRVSDNKKYVTSLFWDKWVKTGGNEKISLVLYNESLEKVWEVDKELEYNDGEVELEDAFITSTGKVIVTGARQEGASVVYSLFVVDGSGVKEIKLDTEKKKMNVLDLRITEGGGQVIVAGLYSSASSNPPTSDGTFIAKLDLASGTLTDFKSNSLGQDVRKNLPGIESLGTTGLVSSEDGNYALIVSNGMVRYSSPQESLLTGNVSGGRFRGKTTGQAVIGFDKELNKKFDAVINNTFNTSTRYTGTDAVQLGNKILVLYNFNEGKTDRDHRFMYSVCDFQGKISPPKDLAFSNKEYFFVPKTAEKYDGNTVIVGASPSDANGFTPVFIRGAVTLK